MMVSLLIVPFGRRNRPYGIGKCENTFLVGVVEHEIVGRLSLRHYLNDFLARIGGHIGYGVTPAHRKKGYATEMLKQALPICSSLSDSVAR